MCLGGGGGGGEDLGFSLIVEVSTLGFSSVLGFSDEAFSDTLSDGDAWAAPSAPFKITATFLPGSTVSPILATNYQVQILARTPYNS